MKQILVALISLGVLLAQDFGVISGKIVDQKSGKALIGVNVMISGMAIGSSTDIYGNFSFKTPVGKYDLRAEYISYRSITIKDIRVEANKTHSYTLKMEEDILSSEVVIVEAEVIENNEVGLLLTQKKETKVLDAISAEQLSKTSVSNVSGALKKISGISIVGGKNVFVRGLGDRYANIQMNGSSLPSISPDKKEVPLHMFSSNVIDNIIVQKTYTADQPGEFSGGSVQIKTKEFPGKRTMSFSFSSSYNSISTFKPYNTYNGGSLDILGYDDGKRSLPNLAYNKHGVAQPMKNIESFSNQWTPIQKTVTPSQSYSLNYANEFDFSGNPLGIVATLKYSNNSDSRFSNMQKVYDPDRVSNIIQDKLGKEQVNINLLLNSFYRVNENIKLGLKNFYLNSSQDEARIIDNIEIDADETRDPYKQTQLKFVQNQIFSTTFNSEINFENVENLKMDTEFNYSFANRYEPNNRRTLKLYNDISKEYELVTRKRMGNSYFFSDQYDNNFTFKNDFQYLVFDNLSIKSGFYTQQKFRTFDAKQFDIRGTGEVLPVNYRIGKLENLLSADHIRSEYLQISLASNDADVYDSHQSIFAGYISTAYTMYKNLEIIAGLRYEQTNLLMTFNNLDDITKNYEDFLPSFNFVYRLTNNFNTRVAYSNTLNRPEFREISPFVYTEFAGGDVLNGNDKLKKTNIENIDTRFEYYMKPGEIIAISGFYKNFSNPIEKRYTEHDNPQQFFSNALEARVYGVELEIRKNLGESFRLNLNTSFIRSFVEYDPNDEFTVLQANTERPLYGQSPYIVNTSLYYSPSTFPLEAAVTFNRFGKRLSAVGSWQQENDEYEVPFNKLDASLTYKFSIFSLKFVIRNLLNNSVRYEQSGYITKQYDIGRTFKLSTKINL
jgi:outer membrane receptor protein involved in Fe transport